MHRLGWKSQAEIGRYSAPFDVCLIPYRADHPFNRERAGSARAFVDAAPITGAERELIAYRNWEKLVAGIRRH